MTDRMTKSAKLARALALREAALTVAGRTGVWESVGVAPGAARGSGDMKLLSARLGGRRPRRCRDGLGTDRSTPTFTRPARSCSASSHRGRGHHSGSQGAQWSRAPWGLSRLSTGLAAVGTLYCRSALIGEARLRVMGEGGWRFTGRGVQRGGGGRTDLGLGRPPQRCGNGPQRTSLCAWSVRTGPRANGPPGGCLIIPRGQRGCLPMRGPPGQGWNHLVRRVGVARGHCRAPSIAQRVCTA
jgi:hypothetical protein